MQFSLETKKGTDVETDLFVFALFKNHSKPLGCFGFFDESLNGYLSELVQDETFIEKEKSIEVVHTLGQMKAKKVLVINAGEQEALDFIKARELFGAITKEALKQKAQKITFCLTSFTEDKEEQESFAHALAEATELAYYTTHTYKTSGDDERSLQTVSVCVTEENEMLQHAVQAGQVYGEATCLARELVNTPGNLLTPTKLAEKAVEIASEHGLEYDILDRKQMEDLGMGALLAVAQGGDEPPKMIVLKYQGLDKWDNVLSFVGKGLTFDTGGISLKPSLNMHEMKMDMGGSAAVLGAMHIIGKLKPKCNVLAVIPSTENMPSGRALKPGDVITSLSGKTIEVRNTDAEGRLILADGVTYAKQLGANYIVDVATLTGAILIALGKHTTGAVTNNEDFMIEVLESADEAGERMWRLPSYEPYKKMVKSSDVADLNNAPGRLAGSITAGLFIGEFAEDTPWVHLDIAGTAWSDGEDSLTPKGGTGSMVRTLATLAERFEDKA